MNQWFYLIALLVSLASLATLDWRYKLAFWKDRRRTVRTIGLSIGIFIIWDLLGIALGIFFHGSSSYALPLRITPELPIEELFFLALLCYVTLLLYQAGVRRWPRI